MGLVGKVLLLARPPGCGAVDFALPCGGMAPGQRARALPLCTGTNFEALAVRPGSVSPREPAGLMAGLGFSAFLTKSALSRTSRRRSVYEDAMKRQHSDLASTKSQPVYCSS